MSHEEAQRELTPMLAEGLVSRGLANRDARTGRIGVSETGRRLLADLSRPPLEDEDEDA